MLKSDGCDRRNTNEQDDLQLRVWYPQHSSTTRKHYRRDFFFFFKFQCINLFIMFYLVCKLFGELFPDKEHEATRLGEVDCDDFPSAF